MARRRQAAKRAVIPDPKYGDVTLSKFINMIMRDGKKSIAEKVIYGALDSIEEKKKSDPNFLLLGSYYSYLFEIALFEIKYQTEYYLVE